jgi:hypothetical protein
MRSWLKRAVRDIRLPWLDLYALPALASVGA